MDPQLFQHNTWATLRMIEACEGLSDAQLDAAPLTPARGTIRDTLWHLVASQRSYVRQLRQTPHAGPRAAAAVPESLPSMAAIARESGDALAELAARGDWPERIEVNDGVRVAPWVVLLQAICHASEHREQLNSLRTALGLEPLTLDGWRFGEASGAMERPTPRG